MAVAPLFIPSMTALKATLRLTAANAPDSLAILDDVVKQVRLGLYDALGSSRVTTILGTSSTDTPTTDAQLLRTKAEMAEGLWVRMLLMDRLPVQFMDAAAGALDQWNEDGLTRDFSASERKRIRDAIETQLQVLLAELKSGDDEPAVRATSFGPAVEQIKPGDTVRLYRGTSCG